MKTSSEYQREYRRRRKQEMIDLLGGVCVQCGSTERLEFDHVDPATKTGEVTLLLRGNRERLVEEVLKCQLLCNSCHQAKTNRTRKPRREHGEAPRGRARCTCSPCREMYKAYRREYMKRWYHDRNKERGSLVT